MYGLQGQFTVMDVSMEVKYSCNGKQRWLRILNCIFLDF